MLDLLYAMLIRKWWLGLGTIFSLGLSTKMPFNFCGHKLKPRKGHVYMWFNNKKNRKVMKTSRVKKWGALSWCLKFRNVIFKIIKNIKINENKINMELEIEGKKDLLWTRRVVIQEVNIKSYSYAKQNLFQN